MLNIEGAEKVTELIKGSKLVVIQDGGHDLVYSDYEEISSTIRDFLTDVDPAITMQRE